MNEQKEIIPVECNTQAKFRLTKTSGRVTYDEMQQNLNENLTNIR